MQELQSRPSKRSEEEDTGRGEGTKDPEAKGNGRSRTRTQNQPKGMGLPRHLTDMRVRACSPLNLFLMVSTRLQYLTLVTGPGLRRVCGGLLMALSDLRGQGRLLHEQGATSMDGTLSSIALGCGRYQRGLARRWFIGG
ncbi:hypothetical protein PMIN01_06312 [Paraphaeosphaeria minitans]|uniref:Uncharacterized protein n=1 Tax=Paraphaeosphaeria minitans TaxID=565426 RepID=A0A9P6GJM8_9PLEO|nr:hypothetical protein PMIN01_06312 [Paraphaeosphaeria minitans]